MYILLEACQHPAVLRFIYFGTLLLDIVSIIVPIGLIIMLLIDFAKAVVANDDGAKKSTKLVTKRIMYAVIIFAVPWIINLLITILSSVGFNTGPSYITCLTNAQSGNFEYYDKLLKEEEALEAEKRKQNIGFGGSGVTGNAMASKLISIAEQEIGNTNGSKYNSGGAEWCAYFVKWVMEQTEYNGKNLWRDIIEKEMKVTYYSMAGGTIPVFNESSHLKFRYSEYYAKKYGKTEDINYTPKPGDVIYFNGTTGDWNGKIPKGKYPKTYHVGFVHHVKNDKVYVLDGNGGCNGKYSTSRVCNPEEHQINQYNNDILGYGSWYNN